MEVREVKMMEIINKEAKSGFSVINADELFEIIGGVNELENIKKTENLSTKVIYPQGPTVGTAVK